ncbi:MAG: transcriptional regulator [Acidimicrobiaceae bacterium]|nr:transcriptional regulator [Acidimicrobiaceae bacterium]MYE08893.1 transcriptional regulator [Acidimicrobiaceae bacterium]MYI35980.1 transcriptional regulator [Acidimicrobiaceae bacterium]
MVLTRDFSETVQERARRDPEFRGLLLTGGVERLLEGEVGIARIILRDYILSAAGFERLGDIMGRSPESVKRLLDPEDACRAGDLLEVLARILRHEGVSLAVSAVRANHDGESSAVAEAAAAG